MDFKEIVKNSGRPDVAVYVVSDGDYFFKSGDTIFIDGQLYKIIGYVLTNKLTDPPKIGRSVGFQIIKQ